MQTPSALRLVALAAMASLSIMVAHAQLVGSNTAETHPPLTTQTCTSSGCTDEDTSIVLDANWRWLYKEGTSTNCYTGNSWDKTICSDPKTCASSCALDGADYTGTYGITAESNSLSLKLVTKGPYSTNIGSRVYMMESDDAYKAYKLLNQEFTFDVDVSDLDCGLNGALYFVDMDTDGGKKRFSGNKAGAKFGTGYCDAQCPQDLKFISGEANTVNWTTSATDSNSGTGNYGSCCAEMDIWESNSISNAYTSHPCSVTSDAGGSYRCESATECGTGTSNRYTGVCDKDGCDFNPYRMGNKTFFGPGSDFTIDTTKKFTRFYIQDGTTYEMPYSTWPGLTDMNSLTDDQCSAAKKLFGDKDDHKVKGGLAQLGVAMKRAMCLWLDSDYPVTADASKAGVARGTCAKTSGDPDTVVSEQADATVVFSNIRFGDIGTTVDGISAGSTSSSTATEMSASGASSSTRTSAPSASIASSSSTNSAISTDASDETSTDAGIDSTSSVASESSQDTSSTAVPMDASTGADSASTTVDASTDADSALTTGSESEGTGTNAPASTSKAPTKQCKTKRY
ncbi:putative glycosyl hydrolase family 7 protein [Phytophthora sojae]|uniref:cellulose 1,4-beta-cellobiosidase (non-reducing end) n=1 Tax=Phytophthora sojae (strain P6497) TaxID=1094619 RepID=G4YUK8_PHYSP|nr:putative glycosyl hydrolase family 7 protein [Phytophthora sojae]EGZ25463.1 putative glycosyl hydrolase family 7 protein [Phytophthora sojae]|eukprot:XP_009520751.1 putative glycosyl hydrolase family 7 protein [Phytophthora sojae]